MGHAIENFIFIASFTDHGLGYNSIGAGSYLHHGWRWSPQSAGQEEVYLLINSFYIFSDDFTFKTYFLKSILGYFNSFASLIPIL